MEREELKKELLERVHNGTKEFNIEKVSLSDNDPILQSARKIGGVDEDYIIKQAREFVSPRTLEELEEARRTIKYPGRKTRTVIQYVEAPGQFIGIKIGRIRIGMWIEMDGGIGG